MSMTTYVGIDIAKDKFDAVVLDANQRKQASKAFRNTCHGFEQFLNWLGRHQTEQTHLGMEATSCYWQDLAAFLYAQGLKVSVINPARIKAYARAGGLRNKSDRLDAATIAGFLQTQQPALWSPPSPEKSHLQQLIRRRSQLLHMQGQEAARLKQAIDPVTAESIRSVLAHLDTELARLKGQIQKHVQAHPQMAHNLKLLKSIKGIGETTALIILAELPDEIRNPRQAAAFAGLTPQQRQSGNSSLPARLSKIGSRLLRQALYLPAMVAARYNPILKKIAERLRANSKSKKAIIGALMHRLMRIAAGVLKNQKPFDPNHLTP